MQGLIVSIIAGQYKIYSEGAFYTCSVKKSLKTTKNVSVGDNVLFDELKSIVLDVLPAKNSLIRPCVNNIDLSLIVSSIVQPEFSPYLILKFITYFTYRNIDVALILTKEDLSENNGELNVFLDEFKKTDIPFFVVSKNDDIAIEEIKKFIKGKKVLFCGQSGVGKSTLINRIEPNFNRLIGTYSFALNRGKHQTKENIILPLNDETYLIDSPGFSSLDLEMDKLAIRDNFPIISRFLNKCKFDNCLHLNEPNCAVKEAVKIEEISTRWYNYYVELLKDE